MTWADVVAVLREEGVAKNRAHEAVTSLIAINLVRNESGLLFLA
jgi:hypothetical protein